MIAIERAKRAALETRLARQRLSAAGRTVTTGWPWKAKIRHVATLAEALGGIGEPQDRADLVAQESDGDSEQHHRGAHHPQQEDVRVRRIGGVAAGEYPHHRVVEPDPDLHQRRAPD